MTAHTIATMAGRMHVTPGAPIPHNLTSSRQDWASRLSAGLGARHTMVGSPGCCVMRATLTPLIGH